MAEGGEEIEMDEMGRDEDNDDYDDYAEYTDESTLLIKDLAPEDGNKLQERLADSYLDGFFKSNGKTRSRLMSYNITKKNDALGRPNLYIQDRAGEEKKLTFYNSSIDKNAKMHYYRLSNFSPGVVRNVLGIEDYIPPSKLDKKQKIAELPKRAITTEQESIELVETIKEIETSFSNEIETGTQTNIDHREMESIMKAMTTVKEEITNELGKLTETNKHIAKENRKLKQAKEDNDEYQIKRISERIRNLESERSARLEVININKDKLRNQINRIKQTIHKILNEDTTLKEKIKTLFREQGVTIVSILTAFGMIIGTIVNTFSGGDGGGGETSSKGKDGIKEWITTLIKKLGKLLVNLAGKAASALPGIIGAIVSWLLSVTGNIVNWFANNLWMLLILVVGLLYTAAREYINKSHK